MTIATNLGFPRIGPKRELKKSLESFWRGDSSFSDLEKTAASVRQENWKRQKDAGIEHIPSNDFSYYDQILDTSCLLGLIPERYDWQGGEITPELYFSMARGAQSDNKDITALEMTKWFDTNYHYLVPEFEEGMTPKLCGTKIFDEFSEAKKQGITTRPVIVGPVTYVALGKAKYDGFDFESFVNELVPVYGEILEKLAGLGAQWVQIDEPILATDMNAAQTAAIKNAYQNLKKPAGLKVLIATYFESLRENADLAFSLPVDAVHIDLCRNSGQANTARNLPDQDLEAALSRIQDNQVLSLGVVDGRNIWRNNLAASNSLIEKAKSALGKDRVFVGPSSSLLHVPIDLDNETKLDDELRSWMAFAAQKLHEISALAHGADKDTMAKSEAATKARKESARIHSPSVKDRLAKVTPEMYDRKSPFAQRNKLQREQINLPLFPTTTIGSFPQTKEIREARANYKKGNINRDAYVAAIKKEIDQTISFQHEVDIDVLVHGEAERNDMVEYFGEQLEGFAFTQFGWVQSYGSRCVKPPVIFGDISRSAPMTVDWITYAQSKTDKVMKGMLTGPITILQWSFVRDDQPRETTARQIALAIRDEVQDLEKAGIKVIQIDEAALREGLPLRRSDWETYLDWAVEAFRLSASGVRDETQIHTHMCYSEFNDIIKSVSDMDADVISIETSRSQMELLEAFTDFRYPNEIGPGVYDIHSPRVPSGDEMKDLLEKALENLKPEQIWVNPDCGLKTRGWKEVKPALEHMVEAAKTFRKKYENRKAA